MINLKWIIVLHLLLTIQFFPKILLAQNGLENIIVEKYYVTDAADSAGSAGNLPVGSVTYRVYADMLPGYQLQVVYGTSSPLHELRFATTTSFFNNEFLGNSSPTFSKFNAAKNTLMLDSWLSVGAAAAGQFGILKSEDNGIATVVNQDGLLQNNDPSAGIPLITQDGLQSGTTSSVTFVGISAAELEVFNNISGYGNLFSTTNGAYSSLAGATGPTASNRILIGQFTTNGDFSFELNLQLRAPNNSIENYVARNPVGNEIQLGSLVYPLNVTPVVSINNPSNGSTFNQGDVVSVTALANDPDGTITQVEFFANGISLGVDAVAPYSINLNAFAGSINLTAEATDDLGAATLSAPVTINVLSNIHPSVAVTSPVNNSSFITGDTVNLLATVNDPDGSVVAVNFYIDGIFLSKDSLVPFTSIYTSAVGMHQLTATAYDDFGDSTQSTPVQINVVNNQNPLVSLISPLINATFITGSPVTMEANASDADGSVQVVDFYINGVLVGSDSTAPYQFVWTAVAGSAGISAVARDNKGANTTSNLITVTILNSGTQQPFTPGNLIVYRVGDGNSILVNTGNPVFLDEYTTSGTLVQSVPMPTAANGLNKGLVASGTGSSEGYMTTSEDGHWLFLTGYDGFSATSLPGTLGSVKNRIIARVDPFGNINTSTSLADFSDGGNPRTVTSTNGTDIWMGGSLGGVRYTTLGSTSSSSVSTTVTNIRQLNIFNGQLYATSNVNNSFRIGTVGAGTPVISGQTMTGLPGIPVNSGAPVGFYFADLSASIAGPDVLYVADEGGLILKYSLVSGTWVSNGSIAVSTPRGIIGSVSAGVVSLYVSRGVGQSSGGGNLYAITDNSGYNAPFTSTVNTIVSASSQTTFRGIAFVPVPCEAVAITGQPQSPAPLCDAADTAIFTVSVSGSGPFTYQWQENGVDISNGGIYSGANSDSLVISLPGISLNGNTYRCIITNCYGGNIVTTDNLATLTVHPNPTVSVTASGLLTFCQGDSVILSASSGLAAYNWSNGEHTATVTIDTSGQYSVKVTNGFGCTALSNTVNVIVNPLPVVNITLGGPAAFCGGDSVLLTAGSGYVSYQWSNGAATGSIQAKTSGAYIVTVTDLNGCSGNSAPEVVTVIPLPSSTITANGPTMFCPGGAVILTAPADTGLTYLWSTGSTNDTIIVDTTASVTLTTTNYFGCTNTSSSLSIVRYVRPSDFNADGITDVLDFLVFLNMFGVPCNGCKEDLSGNGIVDVLDYLLFVGDFGKICSF